jgi:hypothetical protein
MRRTIAALALLAALAGCDTTAKVAQKTTRPVVGGYVYVYECVGIRCGYVAP